MFMLWITADAITSIGMFWLNAHGMHILYRDLQHFKWAFIIVPGACTATAEVVHALRLRSLRWLWTAAPASLFIATIANRPRVWPSSDQELVFTALATIDRGLAFKLAFAVSSETASSFAKRHAVILCAYLGMNALGYFGASLYFPLIGRGLMLGSFLAWMAWVWLFTRSADRATEREY